MYTAATYLPACLPAYLSVYLQGVRYTGSAAGDGGGGEEDAQIGADSTGETHRRHGGEAVGAVRTAAFCLLPSVVCLLFAFCVCVFFCPVFPPASWLLWQHVAASTSISVSSASVSSASSAVYV
jgi:hypothetical protein